jgi:hypothetical protein
MGTGSAYSATNVTILGMKSQRNCLNIHKVILGCILMRLAKSFDADHAMRMMQP